MTDANEPSWKTNPRCNRRQYKFIKACTQGGPEGIERWNKWRKKRPDRILWLQGADLAWAILDEALLGRPFYKNTRAFGGGVHLEGASLSGAHLEGADLAGTHLEGAVLTHARLEGANLWGAHLEGAGLPGAHLQHTRLEDARLEGADLRGADFEGAHLRRAHLQRADLIGAHLEGARLSEAHLEGADVQFAHLEGADLRFAVIDGETQFRGCSIDRRTNFDGVDLHVRGIDPALSVALGQNLRESRWREWYGKWPHWFYRWPVWLFWQISDYGRSVGHIGLWFIALSVLFAGVYFTTAVADPPGIVNSLIADETGCVGSPAMGMWRALYFSIVTMTTLGFGDMHARVGSAWGHGLLMLQVVAGYFLLGVLVSRVTIAFQTVGPAQPLARPKGWWRRWRMKIIWVGVVLVALAGQTLHGWAESKWPEVTERAAAVDGPKDE